MSSPQFPRVMATGQSVVLATGQTVPVTMLNNAATTPPFEHTMFQLTQFMQTYGAFHRGAGPHANLTYEKTQWALETIRRFLGVRDDQTFLFTHNTSSAINYLVRLLDLTAEDIVLTTDIEHTSNNLPRSHNSEATILRVQSHIDGSLDMQNLEQIIKNNADRIRVVSLTGASNMSGYVPDLTYISGLVRTYTNALFFVDAAQLAPHRPINMSAEGIDALTLSSHKLYAPFGVGVLALPSTLLDRLPVDPGGGSIDMISAEHVVRAPAGLRHQIGTRNVTDIYATAVSCQLLMDIGRDAIIHHEHDIIQYVAQRLTQVPGLNLHIDPNLYIQQDRIGTFVFNLEGYHHALLAAILEHEYGIETRAGTICSHRLVRRWFDISDSQQLTIEQQIQEGDRLASYGIVRASLGIHNTRADIDRLVLALQTIADKGPQLLYQPVPAEEIYTVS